MNDREEDDPSHSHMAFAVFDISVAKEILVTNDINFFTVEGLTGPESEQVVRLDIFLFLLITTIYTSTCLSTYLSSSYEILMVI